MRLPPTIWPLSLIAKASLVPPRVPRSIGIKGLSAACAVPAYTASDASTRSIGLCALVIIQRATFALAELWHMTHLHVNRLMPGRWDESPIGLRRHPRRIGYRRPRRRTVAAYAKEGADCAI